MIALPQGSAGHDGAPGRDGASGPKVTLLLWVNFHQYQNLCYVLLGHLVQHSFTIQT